MKPLILMYHRIAELNAVDRYTVSPHQFSRQMHYLRKHGYEVVSLSAMVDWLTANAALGERSVAVTFDDGYLDTFRHACPVLRENGFCATFFVISGLLGKTNSWMTGQGDCSTPLMNWREVETLRCEGFEIGSHTVTHRDLTAISPAAARHELEISKRMLEDRLRAPVSLFAYPYGRYDDYISQLVRDADYRAACVTAPGFVTPDADRHQLPRLEVAGTDSLQAFARKVKFGFNKFTGIDLMRYYGRRLAASALGN